MCNEKYYKVVAFDDDNVFEFKIKVDCNARTIGEVHKFIDENLDKYPSCKWLLLPIM